MLFAVLLAAITVVHGTGPGPLLPDVIYQHPDETTCVGKAEVLENAAWATMRRFLYEKASSYSQQVSRQLTRCIEERKGIPDPLEPAKALIMSGQYQYATGNRLKACRLTTSGWKLLQTTVKQRGLASLSTDDRNEFKDDRELVRNSLAGEWGAWPLANHRYLVHVHGDPPCPAS